MEVWREVLRVICSLLNKPIKLKLPGLYVSSLTLFRICLVSYCLNQMYTQLYYYIFIIF